jgi:hypothetical protein
MLERSIADEVEVAIKAGSTQKHLDTLRQVTDLFLVSADGYSGDGFRCALPILRDCDEGTGSSYPA